MIQYKKIMMTLVALLAVTTGAWADETLLMTIESTDNTSFTSGSKTFDDKVTVTFSSSVYNEGDTYGWYAEGESLLTVAGINGYTITSCKFYTENGVAKTGYTVYGESPSVYLFGGFVYTDANLSVGIGGPGVTKIEVYGTAASSASGVEVAWDKDKKTGSFTMPGGNVTLEPEYYPQAVLATGGAPTAINDVPATTDGAIVKAGTVANIGETETAQGTVMYYVSQKALDDAALLALAADKWTADVPTATHLTEGEAYVYYYVRGNDSNNDAENFSDGDILAANALTVNIAAEPTYAVTFKAANANTIEAGKATVTVKEGTGAAVNKTGDITDGKLKAVKMGSEVKLEANPGYKFRKVEVKKGAATYTLLSAATKDDIGKVVCAAGHLHDAKTAVPDGCTAVGILGKVTSTGGHGLILALKDAKYQNWNTINGWTSASYAGTTLKVLPDDAARGTDLTSYTTLGETAVSDWAVAQKSDYAEIFPNLGSTTGDSDGFTYDGNVNAYITTGVGGSEMSGTYWSATEDSGYGRNFNSSFWNLNGKSNSCNVRPVLGF